MIHRQSIPLSLLTNNPQPLDESVDTTISDNRATNVRANNSAAVISCSSIKHESTSSYSGPSEVISGVVHFSNNVRYHSAPSNLPLQTHNRSSSATDSTESDEDESDLSPEESKKSTTVTTTKLPLSSPRRRSSVFSGHPENGLANYIKITIRKRKRDDEVESDDDLDNPENYEHQYQCLDCSDRFSTTSELRQHKKNLHHIQTYKCRKCGELFRSIADRQTHKNNKHFDTISCTIESDNFREFKVGSVVSSNRNEAGYFSCPVDYCTFVTRIPGYWYDHVHHVEHQGENPQKRKKRVSVAP